MLRGLPIFTYYCTMLKRQQNKNINQNMEQEGLKPAPLGIFKSCN